MPRDGSPAYATGIARSLRIYHRDHQRNLRMDALNAQFARPGGMVFDIGAHVGDRVASFRRLGARVVAVEPQPAAMRALRLMFAKNPDVALVQAAMGVQQGSIRLYLNTRNPTVSTVSPGFIAAATGAPGWEGQHWDHAIDVPMLSLNNLIARHGLPDFIKIDVEGHEPQVIAGLSQPVPALSFEFTTIQWEVALDALERIARLGDYGFNLSIGEEHSLRWPEWVPADRIASYLRDAPAEVNAGDIYARLR